MSTTTSRPGRDAMRKSREQFRKVNSEIGRHAASAGGKPIVAYDPETGEVVAIYDNRETAGRKLGVSPDSIRYAIKHPDHVFAGYLWRVKGIGRPQPIKVA